MAKALYDEVGGVARRVTKKYDGVAGVSRKITRCYDGVDGVARQYWGGGVSLAEAPVGTEFYMNVGGVPQAFIVVHKGLPLGELYDKSCDGIWVLMRNIYRQCALATAHVNYGNTAVHNYLNETFFNLLDNSAQAAVKEARIPYATIDGTIKAEANGLKTKCFLLGAPEVGFPVTYYDYADGAKLDYFIGYVNTDGNDLRKAYYNGTAAHWWLRSPKSAENTTKTYAMVNHSGALSASDAPLSTGGVRPAFILSNDARIDPKTMLII